MTPTIAARTLRFVSVPWACLTARVTDRDAPASPLATPPAEPQTNPARRSG